MAQLAERLEAVLEKASAVVAELQALVAEARAASAVENNVAAEDKKDKKKKRKRSSVDAEPEQDHVPVEHERPAARDKEDKKRFSRVDESKALQQVSSEALLDNRYEAVFGAEGYGAKANEKLREVRGKDFRCAVSG